MEEMKIKRHFLHKKSVQCCCGRGDIKLIKL